MKLLLLPGMQGACVAGAGGADGWSGGGGGGGGRGQGKLRQQGQRSSDKVLLWLQEMAGPHIHALGARHLRAGAAHLEACSWQTNAWGLLQGAATCGAATAAAKGPG
jgi:hypothetical protein